LIHNHRITLVLQSSPSACVWASTKESVWKTYNICNSFSIFLTSSRKSHSSKEKQAKSRQVIHIMVFLIFLNSFEHFNSVPKCFQVLFSHQYTHYKRQLKWHGLSLVVVFLHADSFRHNSFNQSSQSQKWKT